MPAAGGLVDRRIIVKRGMLQGASYAGLLALAMQAPVALGQERIDGTVLRTKTTHCDMNAKSGGCAGTLTMERKADGKTEQLTFNVPLGTPITRAGETAYLPALRGKTVSVTHVTEKNERVAKAIEVAK
jgi:hypothetical protein